MKLALARKYRPQNFLEVIGQDPIVKTLQNAIESNHLHHAYLFCGVRGVGKTSLARILAKSINCEKGPTITPCQKCTACQSITASNSLDVIEIDGASNNLVDDVRELREQVKYLPTDSKYKIIIIDEVHMLSNSAFNALLKTLEEPPAHVIFIFATTEAHKLPITIVSRCQKYDFRKLNTPTLQKHLQTIVKNEKVNIDDAALNLIAQCAQGSVRDGLSLLDQVCHISDKKITEEHVREILGLGDRLLIQETFASLIQEDLNSSLATLNKIDERGLDLKLFAEDLLKQYRNLILMESTKQNPPDLSPAEIDFLNTIKGKIDLSILLAQYQVLFKTIQELAMTEFQKTVLEIAFVKLSQIREMIGLADLVDRIQKRKPIVQKSMVNSQRSTVNSQSNGSNKQIPNANDQSSTGEASVKVEPATNWYELVKWITKEKPPLGSLLKEAIPVTFSDHKIEIALPSASQTKGMLIERVSTIALMLKNHFGKNIDFSITDEENIKKKTQSLNELENQEQQKRKANAEKEICDNQAVKELMEKHGAKVKEIKIIN